MNEPGTLKEFWQFLKAKKKWLIVFLVVLVVLLIGFVFFSQSSATSPFNYNIF
jgi:predicted negative regulator of RcsB-dependent stress response